MRVLYSLRGVVGWEVIWLFGDGGLVGEGADAGAGAGATWGGGGLGDSSEDSGVSGAGAGGVEEEGAEGWAAWGVAVDGGVAVSWLSAGLLLV